MIRDNGLLAEYINIIANPPVNLATAGQAELFVSLKFYERATVLVHKAAGGAEHGTITLRQASAIAGTSAKAINFTTYHKKTSVAALETVGTWTRVDVSATNVITLVGDSEEIYMIDVPGDAFDVTNGFDCLGVALSDPGATAQWGSSLILLTQPRYNPSLTPLTD